MKGSSYSSWKGIAQKMEERLDDNSASLNILKKKVDKGRNLGGGHLEEGSQMMYMSSWKRTPSATSRKIESSRLKKIKTRNELGKRNRSGEKKYSVGKVRTANYGGERRRGGGCPCM